MRLLKLHAAGRIVATLDISKAWGRQRRSAGGHDCIMSRSASLIFSSCANTKARLALEGKIGSGARMMKCFRSRVALDAPVVKCGQAEGLSGEIGRYEINHNDKGENKLSRAGQRRHQGCTERGEPCHSG